MTTVTHDASTAQAQLMEKQMNALSREAEAARRALNGGGPINKEKKLREACEGFEAVFVQKMWEGMRASLPEDGLVSGSKEEKFWQSMYDQELGKSIASSGGIGLADMMMGQLSKDLHKASDVAAMTVEQKPLNIAPAPLMAPVNKPLPVAMPSNISDMYDTPASLQGEKITADAIKDTPKTPAVVQAALDDLQRASESKLIVTTQTFIAGERGERRPIRKQVRVLEMPNNAPAHLGLARPNMASKAATTEAAPIAPYAADTMLTNAASNAPQVTTPLSVTTATNMTTQAVTTPPVMTTINSVGMPLNRKQMPTQMPPSISQQTLTMPPTPFNSGLGKNVVTTSQTVPLTPQVPVAGSSKISQTMPISRPIEG